MQNLQFKPSGCANCGQSIDPKWNPKPTFGSTCEACFNVKMFKPEHFEFVTHLENGEVRFHGTKVMVNGHVGTLSTSFGDWSFIDFEHASWRTIRIGYWELKRLYDESLLPA